MDIEKRIEYQRNYWKSPRGKEVARNNRIRRHKKTMEYQRLYRIRNRERYLAWARANAKTEKGKIRDKVQHHNRRIKLRGLTIAIVQSVYEENIKKFGTLTCELCFNPIEFGQDNLEHFTPLSRGGNNNRENLGIAHEHCNKQKGNKTLAEFKLDITRKEQ